MEYPLILFVWMNYGWQRSRTIHFPVTIHITRIEKANINGKRNKITVYNVQNFQ